MYCNCIRKGRHLTVPKDSTRDIRYRPPKTATTERNVWNSSRMRANVLLYRTQPRIFTLWTNEPQHQKTYLPACAPIECAHPRSLIRIFTWRILDSRDGSVVECGQRQLWSVCADAQANLSLRSEQISKVTFTHIASQIVNGRITE